MNVESLCLTFLTDFALSSYSMERTEQGGSWSLFDPNDVPALLGTFGDAFSMQYAEYEATVDAVDVVPARELWAAISRAEEASAGPFVMFHDTVNSEQFLFRHVRKLTRGLRQEKKTNLILG